MLTGVKVKGLKVQLNKEAYRTFLHSCLELLTSLQYIDKPLTLHLVGLVMGTLYSPSICSSGGGVCGRWSGEVEGDGLSS